MKAKAFGFSLLINLLIFSSLPILHYFSGISPSEVKPIEVDFLKREREKVKPKKKPEPKKELRKQTKLKPRLPPEIRRRMSFELAPGALASEVDLVTASYDVGEVDELPELVEYVEPDYPEEAVAKAIEGVVKLKIIIDQEGRVVMVKVLNDGGFYKFGEAAARAVKRWRFQPAKIMGMPVAVRCMQAVRFELTKK